MHDEDAKLIEVIAKAHGSGSSGVVGTQNAESALKALREAGYAIVVLPPDPVADVAAPVAAG